MSTATEQFSAYVMHWAAVTVATALLWWLVIAPQPCRGGVCLEQLTSYPEQDHVISVSMLYLMLIFELASLLATHFGAKHTQAIVPQLRGRTVPSCLLCVMLTVLLIEQVMFTNGSWIWAHEMVNSDGLIAQGRPVYTQIFAQWCINVPIMLLLAGWCALGRPLKEVSGPLVVTNVYVIFCWAAQVTHSGMLKWALISISLAMYAWSSREMLRWISAYERSAPKDLPGRAIRPWLSSGLAAYFLLYGLVYLSSAGGLIDTHLERKSFLVLTMGSKIAYCVAFVIIRAHEYHHTLTGVLRKVGVSNLAMVSILRGSFDLILPCNVDNFGCCRLPVTPSQELTKLQGLLQRQVSGETIEDLLSKGDTTRFSAYVRNVLRQADTAQDFLLSTQGAWKHEQVAPVAQVLQCKFEKHHEGGLEPTMLNATIHLSVVPRSAVTFGQERQLVAAVLFGEMDEESERKPEKPVFENFDESKLAPIAPRHDSMDTVTTADENHFEGIVASLADLAKLGVSTMLQGSVTGSTEDDGGMSSFDFDQSMDSSHTLALLGLCAKQTKEHTEAPSYSDGNVCGIWEGSVSKSIGGYKQRIEFCKDGKKVLITVHDQTMEACSQFDWSKTPVQLDLKVLGKGATDAPVAVIPYICKLESEYLFLCGPSSNAMVRPRKFEGPGLCIMRRVDETTMPRIVTGPEPEPEGSSFSRLSTEESRRSACSSKDHVADESTRFVSFSEDRVADRLPARDASGTSAVFQSPMPPLPAWMESRYFVFSTLLAGAAVASFARMKSR
eukprot:TRINITY_DN18598_c0_g1_i1.p1 TRINITY_DN18598_c0_g1~~TRINITY_DN18598_c0_g1_i1.p1  ORF type:complete len:781 (-),score=112.30 TRINITY_DN18598_c0_g1_i1:159-2501(-)